MWLPLRVFQWSVFVTPNYIPVSTSYHQRLSSSQSPPRLNRLLETDLIPVPSISQSEILQPTGMKASQLLAVSLLVLLLLCCKHPVGVFRCIRYVFGQIGQLTSTVRGSWVGSALYWFFCQMPHLRVEPRGHCIGIKQNGDPCTQSASRGLSWREVPTCHHHRKQGRSLQERL